MGLKDQHEANARENDFGSNNRELMKPKPCYVFLKEQLSDTMLIILIFAAILSLVLNFSTALAEDYSTGEWFQPIPMHFMAFFLLAFNFVKHFVHLAWIDGTAILLAVIVVAGVGSMVDWRKEIEFVT